jgi:methyl-accepting chemotaxis protein
VQGLRPFGSPGKSHVDENNPLKVSTVPFTYNKTIKPIKGKYLTIDSQTIDFHGEIELDAIDTALTEKIKSTFETLMKERIDSQLKYLNQWISERDKVLGKLLEEHGEIGTALSVFKLSTSHPKNDPVWESIAIKSTNAHKTILAKTEQFHKEFKIIINDWRNNLDQQGIISLQMAVKGARGATVDWKRRRVQGGIVVKAVGEGLKISAVVAVAVVTHGAGIPIACIFFKSLSELFSLRELCKKCKENWDLDTRTVNKVQEDLENFKKMSKSSHDSFNKHALELALLVKNREDKIRDLENEIRRVRAPLKRREQEMENLIKGVIAGLPEQTAEQLTTLNKNINSQIEAARKSCSTVYLKLKSLEDEVQALKKHNNESQKILGDIKKLNMDLGEMFDRASKVNEPIIANVKTRFPDDGAEWFDGVENLLEAIQSKVPT